jgi:hypothetical protein
VLLLRSYGYEARFLLASSLRAAEALEGMWLLLLTPTLHMSTEHRETLLEALRDRVGSAKKLPVVELSPISSGEPREKRGMEDKPWYLVRWPCRIEELAGRLEDILR